MPTAEYRRQKSDDRPRPEKDIRQSASIEEKKLANHRGSVSRLLSVLCSLSSALCLLLSACAMTPKLPPPPPKYVYQEDRPAGPASANSLWRNSASLFEDAKARRLNDLVTILVQENITGSGTADTATKKDSSLDASVTNFLNLPLTWSLNNRYNLTPTVSGAMKDDFKGSGATTREGKLVGTITAKVVEVMPNGSLVVESRKELTVNNEKQILVLRGMARPDDITVDNTIASSRLADAQVYFVGDGVIQDKQRPGWLVRILDRIWPF